MPEGRVEISIARAAFRDRIEERWTRRRGKACAGNVEKRKRREKNGLSVSARIDAIDAISRDFDSSAAIGERNGPRENNRRVRVKRVKLAVVNGSHRRPHRVTTQFTYREKERERENA